MLLTENQLDEWVRGNARQAQGVIVELVWRLVAASSPKPKERRFPLGDSIGQHGPDGVLDVTVPFDPFVPDGRSLWQIGANLNAGAKATSDYTALTKAVPAQTRAETTFVFVTPLSGRRDWEHTWKADAQATWIEERRKRGEWKDVRVIDGTKLIDWVQQFIPVEIWLAKETLGIPIDQIETPEQRWGLVRSIGQPPPLIAEVFLVNRQEASKALGEVLDGTRAQLKLTTHFPGHVIDFVAANLSTLEPERRVDAAGRCLIVSGPEAWTSLTLQQKEKLILVADPVLDLSGDSGTKLIQKARNAGHSVVFAGPQGGIPDPASVPFQSPNGHQIREALLKAGYSEERARTLAQKTDGNLGSLLRCLQNLSLMPEWADGSAASDLAVAAALGAWNEKSEPDRKIVEDILGNAYGEWIGKVREIALCPGTPLHFREGLWKFVSRYEGWYALGPRLFDEHVDRLLRSAVAVLGENDPQFELPAAERYAAAVLGKSLSHSRELRTGLSETLALLGSHPRALQKCSRGKAEGAAVMAVRGLLGNGDWIRWASLNDVLPLLAEAAPDEFLKAVEAALSRQPCPFDELFAQEVRGFTGRTYMTGVLWALETLAWDPDYLSRASICLGELAARDPGGQWANRPDNSLTTIFLPWLPQTCASIKKRGAAITSILSELPEVGWKLLLGLLPESHSSSSGTRCPAWRSSIPDDWSRNVTNVDYWEQVSIYSDLAVTSAKGNVSRLSTLITRLEKLPEPAKAKFLDYLSSEAVRDFSESQRYELWSSLSGLVLRHRKFSNANWAMKPDQVEKIAAVAEKLAPTTPSQKHRRLFGEREFDLYEEKGNFEEQMKALGVARQDAVRDIVAEGGPAGVVAFAKEVGSPGAVGFSFGAIADSQTDSELLPKLLIASERPMALFIGGFVWGRLQTGGWPWLDKIDTSLWTREQIAQFLSYLPFSSQTWDRVSRLLGQDESAYWVKASCNPYEAQAGLNHAIEKLVDYDRPISALRCIHRLLRDKTPIDPKQAVRALLAVATSKENPQSIDAFDIGDIIKALQTQPDTSPDDLFRVEWAYLPMLTHHDGASPTTLERRLATDPKFFCEVIRLVFKSDKQEAASVELSEQREKIAQNAYRLLSEWHLPPGTREDGSFDADAMTKWLAEVRMECIESGHLEIAETMIGHVFIHAPPDSDGLWIHRAVAAVLNAKDAGDMRDGFRTEFYNARGVHWVDPTGRPERELAARCRSRAEAADSSGFPRLAGTLRELAAGYDREADQVVSNAQHDE